MGSPDNTSGHLLQQWMKGKRLKKIKWAIHALAHIPAMHIYHCFVGNSYFCDTAPETRSADDTTTFYREDPLWDGMGCGDGNACPPWFSAHLGSSTTDDIEMRLCRDEARLNEDVTAELIEIYVQ